MKRIFTLFLALATVFAVTKAAEVTFSVVVPTPTYECWVVGNFNGWNNNQHKMNKVDDTHYTLTLDEATFADGHTSSTIRYKYLSGGGDWAYLEKDAAGAEITDRWFAAQDTVQTWAMTFNPNVAAIVADIVVEAYVAKNITELYVTGSFNGWKSPGSEGTKMEWIEADSDAEGNFFRDTIHTEDANKLIYKFAAGPAWVYEQTAGDLKLSDPNAKSVYHENMEFKRIYPGAANLKTVTITATAPAGTQHLYMMGSHLGWDGASWAGTRVADGKFVFEIPGMDLMEYKYYYARDWGTEEKTAAGEGVSNRKMDAQIAVTQDDAVEAWPASFSNPVSPQLSVSFDTDFGGATVVGTPTTAAGKVGNAYVGADASYLKYDISSFIGSAMSVSFMYKVNATPDRSGIIGIGNPDSIVGGTYWNNHFVQGLHLFRENSGGLQRIKSAVGFGTDAAWNDGVDIAADADWAHVVIAVGNGESKIYVNGQLASNGNVAKVGASAMNKAMDITNCSTLEVGISTNFESQGWNHHADLSMIDNLEVFNVALTDFQVQGVMWKATELKNVSANNAKAFYANGALNIPNYNGNVAIFDVAGKMITNNVVENGTINISLGQGAYILKTNTGNFKLMVK